MDYSITFDDCVAKEACSSGIKKARRHLGLEFPRDKPVPLASIIKILGVADTLWVLGHVLEDKDLIVEFAIWNAEQVLPIFEKEFPDDKRPREAIEAAKSGKGLEEAAMEAWAARAAAGAAEAAAWAARAAAGAAEAAAWAAAWAARSAWVAADAAEAAGVTVEDQIKWLEEKLS